MISKHFIYGKCLNKSPIKIHLHISIILFKLICPVETELFHTCLRLGYKLVITAEVMSFGLFIHLVYGISAH